MQQSRILFDTDAENDYFFRKQNEASSELVCVFKDTEERKEIVDQDIDITDGVATLTIKLLGDIRAGEIVSICLEVSDVNRIEPFINNAELVVIPRQEQPSKPKSGSTTKDGNARGKGNKNLSNIDLPSARWVKEDEWKDQSANENFDKNSAVAITARPYKQGRQLYDFFLNEDNIFLKNELRKSNNTADVI